MEDGFFVVVVRAQNRLVLCMLQKYQFAYRFSCSLKLGVCKMNP